MNIAEFTVDTLIYTQAPELTITYEKEDFSQASLTIENSSDEPMKWRFLWPDSLYERANRMSLSYPSSSDTVRYLIQYELPEVKTDLVLREFFLSPGYSRIALRYDSQSMTPRRFAGSDGFIWGTNYETKYILDSTDDLEFRAAIEATWNFSAFPMPGGYEQELEQYATMAAKYPDSRYLMEKLYIGVWVEKYRSKDDIRKVFNNFSEKNRSGYWGSQIERCLSLKGNASFENIELPAWDTHELEPIITDTSKYSLVVFSASWCGPCHAMIPILKNIYGDIGDKINIVYISVDDVDGTSKGIPKNGAEMWGDVMREKEIPWRSVMALGMLNKMSYTYFFDGIPAQFLVAPDLTMEKIDIRDEAVRRDIYERAQHDR